MHANVRSRWANLIALSAAASLFQTGCTVDPDLILQAAVQFLTETAIFLTDSAVVSLR
jgi:hypothetical protein